MKQFILMITFIFCCGLTQSFATSAGTVTGKKVTGLCEPKVTANAFLYTNVAFLIGELGFGVLMGCAAQGIVPDMWNASWHPFGKTLFFSAALVALFNHAVQLAMSSAYYNECRDYTVVEQN